MQILCKKHKVVLEQEELLSRWWGDKFLLARVPI